MDLHLAIGLLGSLLLIIGAALPDRPVIVGWKSGKNWFFAVGSAGMFFYALLGYLAGGPIFFVILQIYIACSTVFMMMGTPDWFDTPALALVGLGLVAWSLALFEGIQTALFVCGLVLLGVGYAMQTGTANRELALAVGSAVIALFSTLSRDWIFAILNIFFMLFSALHVHTLTRQSKT